MWINDFYLYITRFIVFFVVYKLLIIFYLSTIVIIFSKKILRYFMLLRRIHIIIHNVINEIIYVSLRVLS